MVEDAVLSPFGEEKGITTKESTAMVEVAMQREMAEIQAAMTIAKRFPRNQAQATDRILIACQRKSLAEVALYSYARGGTDITDPSIRLAEAMAQNWGNLQFGIRELEQRYGESTVEAYAWDLETNTREVKIFQVKHQRHTKKGVYNLHDPRDIYELVANLGARRLRACILGILPGDVVAAAKAQCEATLLAEADNSPAAVQKMLKVFDELGVTKHLIETRIQRKVESITPAQIINLRKIYNSLKDGMSEIGDWFQVAPPEAEGATQAEKIKSKLKAKGGKKAEKETAGGIVIPPNDPKGAATGNTLKGAPEPPKEPEVPQGAAASTPFPVEGGITPAQLEELQKVPEDILPKGFKTAQIEPMPLQNLTEEQAKRLIGFISLL